jgi:hypothetical protein
MRLADVVEFPAHVGLAGGFYTRTVTEPTVTGKAVGMDDAVEILQVFLRMLSLAIRRIGHLQGRGAGLSCRPLVPHIRPELSGQRLATTGCQHRHWRVVGMHGRSDQDMEA